MGSNGVYEADARNDLGQTLGELLAEQAFTSFELSAWPEHSGLLIFGDEPSLPAIKAEVVRQLRDIGGSLLHLTSRASRASGSRARVSW
ncbi:hypothetical protein [Nannocystis pusilla]|uniref:hypothetical protein n=1 Tax=Nannocystis pusilla TaxID=889268 RepID=UPI003B8219C1